MYYQLKVVVDENDGDYKTALHTISAATLEILRPIIAVVAGEAKQYNWDTTWRGDVRGKYAGKLTEEQIEYFQDYLPWGRDGFHTIETITASPKPDEEVLL